jgi:hypothetical protein
VFDQKSFNNLDDLSLSCIQFGYFMEGQTTVTLGVYIDSTGGAPDAASLRLVKSFDVTTINAVGQMQVQTVSPDSPINIDFESDSETLVVIMTTPVMSEGYIKGGGQSNSVVIGTTAQTYVGDCAGGYMAYSDYTASNPNTQWYVRVHGSNSDDNDDDGNGKNSEDDDSLSGGAIAGISIGVIAAVAALGGVGFFLYSRSKRAEILNAPLIKI